MHLNVQTVWHEIKADYQSVECTLVTKRRSKIGDWGQSCKLVTQCVQTEGENIAPVQSLKHRWCKKTLKWPFNTKQLGTTIITLIYCEPEHTQLLDAFCDHCSSIFYDKGHSLEIVYFNTPLTTQRLRIYTRLLPSANPPRPHQLIAGCWLEGRPICALSIWQTGSMTAWEEQEIRVQNLSKKKVVTPLTVQWFLPWKCEDSAYLSEARTSKEKQEQDKANKSWRKIKKCWKFP